MSILNGFCEEYISEWPARPKHVDTLVQDARSSMLGSKEDWVWCREALQHPKKRWFVASFFSKAPLPRRLLTSMVYAAIEVENPSTNRQFIEPCVRDLGALCVLQSLHKVLENEGAVKQAGAINALYWVHSNPRDEDLSEERAQLRQIMIGLFLATDFVPLQRSIISKLNPIVGEEDPLFDQIVEMARHHEDEYIRHRVEIQLSLSGGPFRILPARNT